MLSRNWSSSGRIPNSWIRHYDHLRRVLEKTKSSLDESRNRRHLRSGVFVRCGCEMFGTAIGSTNARTVVGMEGVAGNTVIGLSDAIK
jgi:hypothetical protein